MRIVDADVKDFFISYNRADIEWAEWIDETLEEAGFSTIIESRDFHPGANFLREMDKAVQCARQTIAVLSPNYLNAVYTVPEWVHAFAADPHGDKRKLIPVVVEECRPEGFLKAVIAVRIAGLSRAEAKAVLLAGIRPGQARPERSPICIPQSVRKRPSRWWRRPRTGTGACIAAGTVIASTLALLIVRPGQHGARQRVDMIQQAPRAGLLVSDVPNPVFGPQDHADPRRGGAMSVGAVELQDSTRPAHEILVSLPPAPAGKPATSWVALRYTLTSPPHPDGTLDVTAGLPRSARPDAHVTFQVECNHGSGTPVASMKSWSATGRDREPFHARLKLEACAGTTEMRLVVVRISGPPDLHALWATALLTPNP